MKVDETELLRVEGLTKHYPGFMLSDISFSVHSSRITGFIGRNGAGKSTTLKCLEGSVTPDSGEIFYFGYPFSAFSAEAKNEIGFELGGADFYRTKKLSLIASVTRRFYPNWDDDAYVKYSRLFDLDQNKRVKELSQGMRVKFALALALSHRSKLLVLDEPTSGLDPASREEVLDIFIRLARERGVGILFSTHITTDLDKCADEILYLRDGRLVGSGSLSEFKGRFAVMPLEEAHREGRKVFGMRRAVSGDTALVASGNGIGRAATLDDIMTHVSVGDFGQEAESLRPNINSNSAKGAE